MVSQSAPKSHLSSSRCPVKRSRAPYARNTTTPELRAAAAKLRLEKRATKEDDINKVLEYIDKKVTELATKFRPYMHFKGLKTNADKNHGMKDNVRELVKDSVKYHELSTAQRQTLIDEFDQMKSAARRRPPNITAKSHAAECSSSFSSVTEELLGLKNRLGTKAFVIMVRASNYLNIAPKVYVTSDSVEQFLRVYLRKDPLDMACKMESGILSEGLTNSGSMNYKARVQAVKTAIRTGLQLALIKITKDASATMEYICYESLVVAQYHVKLIGWTHHNWKNPSDLKGGLELLEKAATREVDERARRIAAGEVLIPNKDPGTLAAEATTGATSVSVSATTSAASASASATTISASATTSATPATTISASAATSATSTTTSAASTTTSVTSNATMTSTAGTSPGSPAVSTGVADTSPDFPDFPNSPKSPDSPPAAFTAQSGASTSAGISPAFATTTTTESSAGTSSGSATAGCGTAASVGTPPNPTPSRTSGGWFFPDMSTRPNDPWIFCPYSRSPEQSQALPNDSAQSTQTKAQNMFTDDMLDPALRAPAASNCPSGAKPLPPPRTPSPPLLMHA
ncbi:hypothetical protein BJ138DRAFT_1117997 [Hygrophoropsis aurantiaca]|uniref:Uncharacterized protein n=1 Tax=Hygrophoropsis aurantiaca TaxID=72124 RepID=A0ACB7ZYK7_9AGAM|nr:hypothetical protein BJ138DRAFT_1117997 [Hygrophoropsis aurantiaca]